MKEPLIILTGPTAVGKTKASIGLAKAINASIISADSIQVYKYMDIGSAKITKEEMDGVTHYLVDCLDPRDPFDITIFQRMAKDAIAEIRAQGKIPMIVGGTGFYIQSVLYDIQFESEDEDTAFREELYAFAESNGAHALHKKLQEIDPVSAEMIHENNVKRVARAIEFYEKTGMKISEHNAAQREHSSPYHFAYYVLNDDRDKLYDRIEKRIDIMVKEGLIDEVRRLKEMGYERGLVSMQGLGYKEIYAYLEGEISLEEAIRILKRDTRHFAKRQLTWFRREKEVTWVNKPDFSYDEDAILKWLVEDLSAGNII